MRPVYYLSVFIPIAVGLDIAGASAPLIFFASAIGVIPTAALMSDATEELAALVVEDDAVVLPELQLTTKVVTHIAVSAATTPRKRAVELGRLTRILQAFR